MRLFVGLALTAAVIDVLARLQPAAAAGVRLVRPDQMHVTLHFVGPGDPEELARALRTVRSPACVVSVRGVGRFELRRGNQILWAGIEPDPSLLGLHRQCAAALATVGFEAERRPFQPHVTLARLTRMAPAGTADSFLAHGDAAEIATFAARRFVLYNSVTEDGVSRYVELEAFGLE